MFLLPPSMEQTYVVRNDKGTASVIKKGEFFSESDVDALWCVPKHEKQEELIDTENYWVKPE